jgi:ribonucleoside-triphosphate reductase
MFINLSLNSKFEEWYKKQPNMFLIKEGIGSDNLDIQIASNNYLGSANTADSSFDANANNDGYIKSPEDHYNEMFAGQRKLKNISSLYNTMAELYGHDVAGDCLGKHIDGSIYIHDSSHMNKPYCFAYSSHRIMTEGRYWAEPKHLPPKRATSFISQVIETTIEMSNQFAGAVAISDFLVNYAWYANKENLNENAMSQHFQRFIYTLNGKYRSTQPPFVNISIFDDNNIKVLFESHVYPDMTKPIDIISVINKVQSVFMDVFEKGDSMGKPFRFPVVTANLLFDEKEGFYLDEKFINKISEKNYKKGVFNIYVSDSVGKLSSCCRLVNDFKLLKGLDSFGNGGMNIGSHKVVTINLPRIGLLAKNKNDYMERLKSAVEVCEKILVAHRALIKKRARQGCLKFIEPLKYVNIDKMLFSTIGIVGVYESAIFMGYSFSTDTKNPIYKFISSVLTSIRELADKISEKYNVGFNVEQVPAESLAYKFVEKDKLIFGNDSVPFDLYSNQFVPLSFNTDPFDRIKIDGMFSKVLSGGGITHLNFTDNFQSPDQMKKVLMFAIENGLEHFAIEHMISECAGGHISVGNFGSCPICNAVIIEKYVRVVGYRVPISSINKARRIYDIPNRKYTKTEVTLK